jgi:NADPH:quinone reductase-like Zn-dependent oxidoreductase
MKAVRLQSYGDVDRFKVEDVPDPVPGANEVLIKVAASGLNPVDLHVRQGFLAQYFPMELPAILGLDAAGTIAAVGSGVTDLAVGDRVIARLPLGGRGAHAEFAVGPLDSVAKLPANVSFEAGATLPLAGLTARQAVDALGVKPGDRVLVSGALGAVGRAAVQYLRELGAKPVAGVRAERLDEGQALAGEALNIDEPPTSATFACAVSAAGPVAANAIKHVRDGGTLASVVQTPEGANPGDRIKIVGIMTHADAAMLQRIADAAGRGGLTIPIAATFRLTELGEAQRALAAGAPGKIVLKH